MRREAQRLLIPYLLPLTPRWSVPQCLQPVRPLRLTVRDDVALVWPQARTSEGWLTFGFAEELTSAAVIALNGMLDSMMHQLAVSRTEALALASVGVHLRVTQIANRRLGVHALWPNTTLR